MATPRKDKVGSSLRQELTQLIRTDVKDPRVHVSGILTIGEIDMSRDLSIARIPVSFAGTPDAEADAAFEALERAAGFLRGAAARSLGLRHAPELRFIRDRSAEMAQRLDELLHEDKDK